MFDGNIESLKGDYIFDTSDARSVSVHSAGITEALRHMYRAERIVQELLRQ
ncbi:MAG: S46 family peptidase [Gemmatimonadota bacterium]|nr:MAG: S46 family peptidase [Gemmatimonadota bacterium]